MTESVSMVCKSLTLSKPYQSFKCRFQYATLQFQFFINAKFIKLVKKKLTVVFKFLATSFSSKKIDTHKLVLETVKVANIDLTFFY